jgi:hypothetical protein
MMAAQENLPLFCLLLALAQVTVKSSVSSPRRTWLDFVLGFLLPQQGHKRRIA